MTPPPEPSPTAPKRSSSKAAIAGAVTGAVVVLVLLIAVVMGGGDDAGPPTTTLRPGTETVPTGPGESTTTEAPSTSAATTTTSAAGSLVTESCSVPELFTRPCDITLSSKAAKAGRLPVVILMHGFTGDNREVRTIGQWEAALAERDFLLVTPGGLANSWNSGICCGIAQATGVDDVSYLSGLITRLTARADVDPSRIYLAGFSNGGMMTYRYLCADASRIAAAASVAGTRTASCFPSNPTSVLHVHGTVDETVPYRGGAGVVAAIMGVAFAPVETSMAEFAAGEQCPAQPVEATDGNRTTRTWSGCANGATVELVTLTGWGHDWMRTPFDTTAAVLDFFAIT